MRREHMVLCGEAASEAKPGQLALRIGPRSNVQLQLTDIATSLAQRVPDRFVDLLEIATYVYVADQAFTRGGNKVTGMAEGWTRRLHFRLPVRTPDLWSDSSVLDQLTSTLGFLSGDDYTFEFIPMRKACLFQSYLLNPPPDTDEVDEVALFSGGLDSLAGAIQAIGARRRVALVSHNSSSKLLSARKKLLAQLRKLSSRRLHAISVEVTKKKQLTKEHTQRSRSFLYASLAATVATMLEVPRIRFYENGVLSLHLPVSHQLIGSRASRSTHPRVLNGFANLFTKLSGHPFEVQNPFLWKTKTEVVQSILDAGHPELIGLSNSCMHTWTKTREHPHCGSCSQCFDRRFAVLAAGAADQDPATGYKVDLFTGEQPTRESRLLLAAHVETADAIRKMRADQFLGRFGEVAQSLRWLGEPSGIGALKVFDLYKRHAASVSKVVDEGIAANIRRIRERTLPENCLTTMVCGRVSGNGLAATSAAEPLAPMPAYMFRHEGHSAWRVRFAGGRTFILLASKGAAYLYLLLQKQGTAIPVTRLAATVAGKPEEFFLSDAAARPDAQALRIYEALWLEIEADLAEARKHNDHARAAALEDERSTIAQELKGRGFRGKPRNGKTVRDSVRTAVKGAIDRARKTISHNDSPFSRHLDQYLTYGYTPRYDPPDLIPWAL